MQIYIADSDYEVLKKLELLIGSSPKQTVKCFTGNGQLIDAVRKSAADIVFVDVDSTGSTSAVRQIQSEEPDTKIIIMSKDREKVLDFFKLHADGFLTKPIKEAELREQLFRARHPFLARIKYGNERTENV